MPRLRHKGSYARYCSRWIPAFAGMTLFCVVAIGYAAEKPAVDPAACRALANQVNYQPSPDVDYKPGVDVHGKPVAPADLDSGSPPLMPKVINIPLTVSLTKALNIDPTQYPYNQLGEGTEATLGTLSIEGNKVTLNGKPLSGQQQSNLAALCNQSH